VDNEREAEACNMPRELHYKLHDMGNDAIIGRTIRPQGDP
jgi:hypothetical protein